MCYSKDLSMKSFLFGLMSSFLLFYFGNKNEQNVNTAIATYFVFISFIQLMEYMMWDDIECKTGKNYAASLIGPILNLSQPCVMLLVAYYFLESREVIPKNNIIAINLLYVAYVACIYYDYIVNDSDLCTKVNSKGHLEWSWFKKYNAFIYCALLLINGANFIHHKSALYTIILGGITLFVANKQYKKSVGELWCYNSTGIPLGVLLLQQFLIFK